MRRVRTLTGKEIELDIEPDYKVRPSVSNLPHHVPCTALPLFPLLVAALPSAIHNISPAPAPGSTGGKSNLMFCGARRRKTDEEYLSFD